MNILFIIDKIELKYFEFNNLVTNFWIIKEFLQRGYNVEITTEDKLSIIDLKARAISYKSYLKDGNIFYEKVEHYSNIEDFDLVMFRQDPPVDLNYINSTYVMDFVDKSKVLIMNDPQAIRGFNEKLHALYFAEYMPEALVTSDKKTIKDFLAKNKEIILKPLNLCFGANVMFLKENDVNTNSIIKSMTNDGQTLIMCQKYIPEAKFGDKRVLTLGDTVLDECVQKLPTKDDFKFNTHSDDFIKKAVLTEEEKTRFTEVAKKLNAMGIYMAGLDVINSQIIEVNVTSPCYFIKEINNHFSAHIETKICDYIVSKVEEHSKEKTFK